ncbi:zinc-dependent alcohol dehydrogenase [Schleiferilactobacillus perolens]|uniref:Sorbitol dehydrogenase n=1 Tax=Schleiferilactobacillus perolens DSM 12744 TaxID=1423792 RepID=A0A0R1NA17_9LACO|nr:alcohol dehydrogenase catalytic domain-containing protein [Schleiferilactobacillus perolens]KRL14725.1 sorbitol dehydrogenase [Schleiferilactobacillus perolens DSM 12744]
MKAAIYKGKKNIELVELPTPQAGDDDVVIQNIYAGICGSDVAVYNHGTETGHKVGINHEFGHEAISRVAEVGKNVTGFKVGERVYPYPLYARGDTSRAGSMGAFSEYILIPNAQLNKQLYPVPQAIDTRIGAMIEPFTVGTCAARHGDPHQGDQAIVYGAGTIGLSAAVALTHFGVKQVVVVDQSDFRLNIARQLGFETINNAHEDVRQKGITLLGSTFGIHGECPDAAIFIDAVGRNDILHDFIEFGPIDSRFVSVGINNTKPDFNFLELTYGSKSVGGSGGYRPEDVHTVMTIMASQQFNLATMITQEVDQAHLEEGIKTATDVDHALKVLVNYHIQ